MAKGATSEEQHEGAGDTTSRKPDARDIDEVRATLPEAATVTLASLVNLLRLMGAELVMMQPESGTERFEQAVRAKIHQFASPTTNQHAHEAGLAYAQHLMEQVLIQIRAQAEVKRSLAPAHREKTKEPGSETVHPTSRLLN